MLKIANKALLLLLLRTQYGSESNQDQ